MVSPDSNKPSILYDSLREAFHDLRATVVCDLVDEIEKMLSHVDLIDKAYSSLMD